MKFTLFKLLSLKRNTIIKIMASVHKIIKECTDVTNIPIFVKTVIFGYVEEYLVLYEINIFKAKCYDKEIKQVVGASFWGLLWC